MKDNNNESKICLLFTIREIAKIKGMLVRVGFSSTGLLFLLIGILSVVLASAEVSWANSEEDSAQNMVSESGSPSTTHGKIPQATHWIASLSRNAFFSKGITNLSFPVMQMPVTLVPNKGMLRPFVEIHGSFQRPGWSLFSHEISLSGDPKNQRDFTMFVYLTSKTNKITLTARGPNGETTEEHILVKAPDAQEFRISSPWGEVLASIGVSNLYYFQTGYGKYNATTGLVTLAYTSPRVKSPLGLYSELRTTAVTMSSNPKNLGPQLVEIKLDGTYLFANQSKRKLQFWLLFGGNYLTLLSNGGTFGFSNLVAPEVGARATYVLSPRSGLLGDIRYVPLGDFSNLGQCGVDINLGWTSKLANEHRVEINLSISNFVYQPDKATQIQATLASLRFGYSI